MPEPAMPHPPIPFVPPLPPQVMRDWQPNDKDPKSPYNDQTSWNDLERAPIHVEIPHEYDQCQVSPEVLTNPDMLLPFEVLQSPDQLGSIEFIDEHDDTGAWLNEDQSMLFVFFGDIETSLHITSDVLLSFDGPCRRFQMIYRRSLQRKLAENPNESNDHEPGAE